MYPGEYTLIGNELSFFSRKLEAQLRVQQIPWKWQYKTMESSAGLEARAGTHFIPLLNTPDKWLIHDTIAIGPMLSARFSARSVLPETPLQRACCFILEDAFNHWLGRTCVHSRWCYPDNVQWCGLRFGANMVLNRSIESVLSAEEQEQVSGVGAMMYESFGKSVCDSLGVGPEHADAVQADFQNLLRVLSAHFAHNDFLLGARPCLADLALAGAFRAHFMTDPTPRSWLGQYSDVLVAYTERFYQDWSDELAAWPEDDVVPASLRGVFDYLQSSYFKSSIANIAAGLAGEKFYEFDHGYGPVQARTQRRLNVARLHVQNELSQVDAENSTSISDYFVGSGILEHYLS